MARAWKATLLLSKPCGFSEVAHHSGTFPLLSERRNLVGLGTSPVASIVARSLDLFHSAASLVLPSGGRLAVANH